MTQTVELINRLSVHLQDLDTFLDNIETKKRNLVPVEVLEEQAEIDAKSLYKIELARNQIADLRSQVEQAVIREGHTVKGDMLMAVYNKGRETWDGKLLSGFALAHPEIEAARKVGNPTISIRKV